MILEREKRNSRWTREENKTGKKRKIRTIGKPISGGGLDA
jgi:hypothetical protein